VALVVRVVLNTDEHAMCHGILPSLDKLDNLGAFFEVKSN
jgi:hypothetical protein